MNILFKASIPLIYKVVKPSIAGGRTSLPLFAQFAVEDDVQASYE